MARNAKKRMAVNLAADADDMKTVELLRLHLKSKLSGMTVSISDVIRYALKRAVEADQLEKAS